MFEKIGRFGAWWPIQLPFMRRLAQSNPRDFGKLVVYSYVMKIATTALLSAGCAVAYKFLFKDLEEEKDKPEKPGTCTCYINFDSNKITRIDQACPVHGTEATQGMTPEEYISVMNNDLDRALWPKEKF